MVRLELPSIPKTSDAAKHFVAVLDQQIDELGEQLANLQALRRSTAEVFGIDRRADATRIVKALDGANRAQYEGDVGEAGRKVGGARQ